MERTEPSTRSADAYHFQARFDQAAAITVPMQTIRLGDTPSLFR
jgi:hypothetical protein